MITKEQQKQGQELLNSLIQKAWDNPEFKNQLAIHPKETIAEVIGKDTSSFSSEKEWVVEDQTDESVIFFNIPQKVDLNNFELTAEQLETVSGGFAIVLAACALFTVGVLIGDHLFD